MDRVVSLPVNVNWTLPQGINHMIELEKSRVNENTCDWKLQLVLGLQLYVLRNGIVQRVRVLCTLCDIRYMYRDFTKS